MWFQPDDCGLVALNVVSRPSIESLNVVEKSAMIAVRPSDDCSSLQVALRRRVFGQFDLALEDILFGIDACGSISGSEEKRAREGCSRRKEAVLRGVRSRRLGLLVSWRAEIGSEVGSYPQGRGLFLVYDLFFLVFKSLKTQL
jgi:hypothetical protein